MKNLKHLIIGAFILSATMAEAQSESFQSLKDQFGKEPNVHSFSVNGFLCRTFLLMAGEWEFRDAISDVKNIRLITIPNGCFRRSNVSVGGFRKILQKDHFESLTNIRDHADRVEVFVQQHDNRKDRYLVLVEDHQDVTVIELRGTIDLQKLKEMDHELSFKANNRSYCMKKILVLLTFLVPHLLLAQSKTTDALEKRFDDSFTAFFYKNTLRMINQTDNKEFDEMIRNIEKLKFLMVDKAKHDFGSPEYKKLKGSYASELYEEILTSRYEGRNFDVYLKDKKGAKLGTVVLVNDSTNLYVLDMIGTIDVTKVSKLFSSLDGSSEIAQRIKAFTENVGGKHKKEKSVHID